MMPPFFKKLRTIW